MFHDVNYSISSFDSVYIPTPVIMINGYSYLVGTIRNEISKYS